MQKTTIIDPYATPLFEAQLIKQKCDIYIDSFDENRPSKMKVQIEINLVPGGIEVVYNSKTFQFKDSEKTQLFRRQINGFFIKIGFFLESVYFPINVYRCCSKSNNDKLEFMFKPNDAVLNDAESTELNKIIAMVFYDALVT